MDNHTSIKEREEPGALSKALKVLAYPVSALVGYWFTETSIRNSAYDNVKFSGAIDDLLMGENGQHTKVKRVGAQAVEAVKKGETFDLIEHASPLHYKHVDRVTERFGKLNLGTLYKQWKFTSGIQRQQALMNGFTAVAITIGALLTMANSKTVSNAFNRRDKESDSPVKD